MFSQSLTAILLSRFLLNLQEANLRPVRLSSDDSLHFSALSDESLPSFVAARNSRTVNTVCEEQRHDTAQWEEPMEEELV